MAKKLYKSKTNYTLKRLHQSGSYGNIYERDILTISNAGSSPLGQVPIYQSPTFKFTIRAGFNGKKIYNYGDWLTNDYCSTSGTTSWTLSCLPTPDKKSSKIVLKPNTHRLTDFVCYGSASELIRASINDILCRFPGEIFVTDEEININSSLFTENLIPVNSDLYKALLNTNDGYFIVDNPMGIDLTQLVIPENNTLAKIKFLCESYKQYNILTPGNNGIRESENVISWDVISKENIFNNDICLTNGMHLASVILKSENNKELVIEIYYYEGDVFCISKDKNYSLRPKDDVIDEFFNSLDDFQKVLLNRNTNYTAKIETYIDDEDDGWYVEEIEYTWPVGNGDWNLSIDGIAYDEYIKSLEVLAEGYDSNFTDAIWRTMTHEAIGNMDLTLTKNGEGVEMPNSSKIKQYLNIVGRQFDEIKKYADNIKNSNNVTYEQDKNIPDYFLTDKLELSGWETKNILNEISEDIFTEPMYGSRTIGFTASDGNNEFLRRLILNSKYIFSKKGTRQSIEDLMAIFGFHSVDWLNSYHLLTAKDKAYWAKSFIIKESIYKIKEITDDNLINKIKLLNSYKNEFNNESLNNPFGSYDPYQGLPLAEAYLNEKTYLIPWFDKTLKYDGDLYFQGKGGWMRNMETSEYNRTVSNIYAYTTKEDIPEFIKSTEYIYYIQSEDKCYKCTKNNDDIWNFSLYPVKNGKEVNTPPTDSTTKSELYLKYGEKYYVWSDKNNKYIELNEKPYNFFLESGKLDDVRTKVIDINKGNNPHSGEYDDGENYKKAYQNFFINSTFNEDLNLNFRDVETSGFTIERQLTNKKCVFIKDDEIIDNLYNINNKYIQIIFDLRHKKFIEENVLHYLKQIIPSTTIVDYDFRDLNKGNYYAIENESISDVNTNVFGII